MTPVVYIIGAARSGTTILGNCLGTLDGVFVAGELSWITTALKDLTSHPCGCGLRLVDCPVWTPILETIESEISERSNERKEDLYELPRLRSVPRLALTASQERDPFDRIYGAIARETAAVAIVDTSKSSGHAALLARSKEHLILHVVRDPRAVVNSWRHRVPAHALGAWSRRWLVAKATLNWIAVNAAAALIHARARSGFVRIRYEDFVRDPASILASIAEILDTRVATRVEGTAIDIPVNHSAGGSRTRFEHGRLELREQAAWRNELPLREKFVVTALAWPLMLRYGYLRRDRPTASPRTPGPGREPGG
jgi:hypothetical protein